MRYNVSEIKNGTGSYNFTNRILIEEIIPFIHRLQII